MPEDGVQGYPTIKYFTGATAATGDAYNGGRDYDALSAWAKDNLGPSCGAENIDLCDADQKAAIQAKQKLSDAELDAEITAVEAELKAADTELEELLKCCSRSTRRARRRRTTHRRQVARPHPAPLGEARQGVGQV